MKKRIGYIIVACIFMVVLFAGCAATAVPDEQALGEGEKAAGDYTETQDYNMPAASAAAADNEAGEEDSTAKNAGYSTTIVVPDTTRKIILTQYITTKTKNFDSDLEKLNNTLSAVGGYLEESSVQGTKPKTYEDKPRTASFTFRVPREKAEEFVKTALTVGEVVSNKTSGQDITEQYIDTETRIKTQRTRLNRLEELLSKATKMADIVTLEEEISNVTYEIESLEGQKKGWDNLVDYATIHMEITEINTILANVTGENKDTLSFGEQLSNGFFSVLNAVVDFFKTLALILIAGSPVIVPVAIIVLVIIFGMCARRKKEAAKTEQSLK